MGYSKLTYEEYIENPEFYLASGILAPKWANELYGKGYKGVCAIDFYDDIFGGDLEEHRMPEDYQTGEYAAIAIEQVKQIKDGKETIKGRRITVPDHRHDPSPSQRLCVAFYAIFQETDSLPSAIHPKTFCVLL